MSQKIKPNSFRLGIHQDWDSRWFLGKKTPYFLEEDMEIRKVVNAKIGTAGIDKIVIERNSSQCKVTITFDYNLINAGGADFGIDYFSNFHIFLQKIRSFFTQKPPGIPILMNAETK